MKQITSNPAHRDKKQLVLENFGGVDFSSSPLNVAKNRASFACNLINDNGVNHKRPGWDEKYKVSGKINKINGIFEYVNGNYEALIVYAGKTFYHTVDGELTPLSYVGAFVDGKVQFFPHKDKVFIIGCGDYLVYGDFGGGYQLKPVADIAYVPTTSVNGKPKITEFDSGLYSTSVTNPESGVQLESINIFTRRRKNTFVGKYAGYRYYGGDGYSSEAITTTCYYYTDVAFVVNDGQSNATATVSRKDGIDTPEDVTLIIENGKGVGFSVTKDFRYDSDIENAIANVTFEFEAIEAAAGAIDADYITGCTFGTLFGAAGASDRLFLSGNPDYPNCDFYSEFDDYTYFTAQSQTVMGSDDVPITGYVRLSDDTLAVMKAGAVHEPSIYYRRAAEIETVDDDRVKKIVFTRWAGGTGEACVNPYTVASLAEDDLILSPNGVFGIVEVNNQGSNGRYMRERSRFINGKLLGEAGLNEACAFVYKNRYYLAVPTPSGDERNGVCYVADPRFKTYRKDDIDGTFNYEWWYWENIPARCFAVIGGQLWFGTADGRICAFDDEFCDRTYDDVAVGEGEFMFKTGTEHTFDSDVEFSADDEVIAEGDALYCEYLSANKYTVKNGKIHSDTTEIYSGTVVYADNVGGSGLAVSTEYTVQNVDRGAKTFELHDEDEKVVVIKNGGFRLCRNMIGKTLYVKDVDDGEVTLAEFPKGAALSMVNYNNGGFKVNNFKICKKRDVCSSWYTPVFDLGATDMLKTMFGMTITIDPTVRGELKLVYETANDERAFSAKEGANAFDFENFSFEDLSFAQGFTSARSFKTKVRKFNYIMFKFISNNDGDCAVSNFKIIYTLNNRFKGYF